jgi:hypothetical protein
MNELDRIAQQEKQIHYALMNNSLKEMKKYFTDSEITKNEIYSDLQLNINLAFKVSINNKDMTAIKYLLNSPDLDIHADIHFDDDYAIKYACNSGNKDLVDYLLNSSELKENATLPEDMDKVFNSVLMNAQPKQAKSLDQQYDYLCFLTFLVNDCKIRPTDTIINILKTQTHPSLYEPAIKQLAQNELYHSLQDELKDNTEKTNKKLKI